MLFLLSLAVSYFMNAQEKSQLKQWVKQVTLLHVRMMDVYIQIPIDDETTAMKVKQHIQFYDRVPVEHLEINPYWKRWWTLWLTEGHGADLKNIENIKRVMSDHNTNLFEVRNTRKYKPNANS